MLVAQSGEFCRRYPQGMPASDQFNERVIDDALLEATLVHLRLLDDFLASSGSHPHDIRASDWVSHGLWQPTDGWLSAAVRQRINWQVAHLSSCRDVWFDWEVRKHGRECCTQLESFMSAVETHRPDRIPAFADARECVRQGLQVLAP